MSSPASPMASIGKICIFNMHAVIEFPYYRRTACTGGTFMLVYYWLPDITLGEWYCAFGVVF